ncbi:MAG: FixH family protein [Aggregatilineales bacterium]
MKHLLHALLIMCALSLGACRQSAQLMPTPDPDIQLEWLNNDRPLRVGLDALVFTLHNAHAEPIQGAVIEVRGDMTHPGMVPVDGRAEGGTEDGHYVVPFRWTMGGDWIVTVRVRLPDGRATQRRYDVQVRSQ